MKDSLLKDFQRMDLMLKSFQRIGKHERNWFIQRLTSDHEQLLRNEQGLQLKRKPGRPRKIQP
jgi:hypothetical protein